MYTLVRHRMLQASAHGCTAFATHSSDLDKDYRVGLKPGGFDRPPWLGEGERERERDILAHVICRAPSGRAQQRPFGLGEGFSPSLGVDACLSGGGLTPSARGRYQIKQDPFQAHTCDSFYQFV